MKAYYAAFKDSDCNYMVFGTSLELLDKFNELQQIHFHLPEHGNTKATLNTVTLAGEKARKFYDLLKEAGVVVDIFLQSNKLFVRVVKSETIRPYRRLILNLMADVYGITQIVKVPHVFEIDERLKADISSSKIISLRIAA